LILDQKNAIFGFCQKFPQAMDEVEKYFWPISKSGCQFSVFAKNFRRPWMKLKNFFGQFLNP
jgi:hypothetical protein